MLEMVDMIIKIIMMMYAAVFMTGFTIFFGKRLIKKIES